MYKRYTFDCCLRSELASDCLENGTKDQETRGKKIFLLLLNYLKLANDSGMVAERTAAGGPTEATQHNSCSAKICHGKIHPQKGLKAI